MKKITARSLTLALTLASLSATFSCKDYLDVEPLSSVDAGYVFSSVSGTTSALVGAYDLLSGDYTYGQRLSAYYPYDSDEIQVSGGTQLDNGRRGIARYTLDANNTELERPWNALYQGVERANVCIQYIPRSEVYLNGSETDKAAMRSLLGQAYTLRAQYMFELIRNWGDVPAPLLPAASTPDLNLPNADRDATYDQLLEDLKTAEGLVPWKSSNGDERISLGAVKALRARIALYRGGYSLRQSGAMERGSNYQQYYQIARDECSEIISSGRYSLNPDFMNLFKKVNELTLDNSEIMFEVAMAGASLASDSKLGYYTGPKIDASSRYGAASPGINALPTYFYSFDTVDVRRDVTLTTYQIGSNNAKSPVAFVSTTDGKFRRDWRTPLFPGTVQYLGYNWPVIRYADVLLMFAEAQNELAGPTAAVGSITPKDALELVRKRAYRGNESLMGTTPTDKDAFFTALMQERLLEFGGEGIRKYDLVRWNKLGQKLAETRAGLLTLRADTLAKPSVLYWKQAGETYQLSTAQQKVFFRPALPAQPSGFKTVRWLRDISANTANSYASGFRAGHSELLPIPQVVIDNNKNLKQNPGY